MTLVAEQAVVPRAAAGGIGDVVAEEAACRRVSSGAAEGRVGELGVHDRQSVGDHRPAADGAQVGRLVLDLDAEVGAGLLERWPKSVAEAAQVVQNRGAVAEEVGVEARVGRARRSPAAPSSGCRRAGRRRPGGPEVEQARDRRDDHAARATSPPTNSADDVEQQLERRTTRRRPRTPRGAQPRQQRELLQELEHQQRGPAGTDEHQHVDQLQQRRRAKRRSRPHRAGGTRQVVDVGSGARRAVPALAVRNATGPAGARRRARAAPVPHRRCRCR